MRTKETTIMTWTARAAFFSFLLAVIGCASSPPPRQLLDARAAYNQARMGKAAQYTPADLHTAKVALNAAEQAFEDDPESPETFALSYVALRTSQLVESKANTKAAEADADRAETEYNKLQEGELARTRSELGVKSQQLASTSEQLTAERKARAEAEERYREAMRKLAEAAALNVKEETRGTVIVLPGSVLFDTGKSTLTAIAQQKLTLVAGTIAPQAEEHDIVVEGHTDSRGSRDFNMSLSQQRAQTVMNFMVSRGVPAESITAVGVGPDRPIADNNSRDGRAENRRVEIVIKPSEKR
jgi:outer membrane protein OmpA-like peptidoglycan-associated protein